jgi:hypothetical protein
MKLLKQIDSHIETENFRNEYEKVRKSHHPSEVLSCNRAIVYKWMKADISNPRDATSVWRMEMGKAVELLAIKYLREMGFDVDDQREITIESKRLKYPIHGYIDIWVNDNEGGNGAEVKTTWGYGTTDVSNNGPREQDISQSMVYMSAENQNTYNLIYIARDTLWRNEYVIRKSDEELRSFMSSVEDKFSKIEDYVENNIIPPRDFKAIVADGEVKSTIQRNGVKYKSDWNCLYCVRRDLCYAEERSDYGLHIPEGL